MVQSSNMGTALIPSRAYGASTDVSVNPAREVAHSMPLSDKPREVSNANDRTRARMHPSILKRSYTNLDISEASRKRPRMDTVDQQSLDADFQHSKRRGSPPSTSRPPPTITSPPSVLDDIQSQTGSKKRKHIPGAISSRKSQLFDVQDGQREPRKTFSLPVPEFTLFYASPKVKSPNDTALEESNATTDVPAVSLDSGECDNSETLAVIPDNPTGNLVNANAPHVSGKSLDLSNLEVSANIPAKTGGGLSKGEAVSTEGSRIVVDVAFAFTSISTSLPCQEYLNGRSEPGCSSPLATPGTSRKEGLYKEMQRLPPDVSTSLS